MFSLNLKIFIFGLALSAVILIFKSVEASVIFFAGVTLAMASIAAYSDICGTLLRIGGRVLLPMLLLVIKFSVLIYLLSLIGSDGALRLWLVFGLLSFIPVVILRSSYL